MPTEILIKTGTAIVFADATDHAPAAGNDLGAQTDQLDLTGLGSGAYRQSDKADFGATRAKFWEATGAFEFTSAPAAGGRMMLYAGWSHSATDGTGNPGNLSGSDGAYTGYGGAASDADEMISQLELIGIFAVSNDADVQIGNFWLPNGSVFIPRHRYGIVVVKNDTSVSLDASDAAQMSVRLSPVVDESQ